MRQTDVNNKDTPADDNAAMFALIRASLWGSAIPEIDEKVYREMKAHSLTALPADVLPKVVLPQALRDAWMADIYQQIAFNVQYRKAQASLPVTVPYAILKGTAAAQYYPKPLLRAMGDIDILTRREDFGEACLALLQAGFCENTEVPVNGVVRHRCFRKEGIEVEVHTCFAMLSDPEKARYVDDLIISGINANHDLPDLVNGLVILEHIGQHLDEGLGLRQIVDWMMFVDKCLTEADWPAFQQMVGSAGLERLAVVVTRMCELYLGLPERSWSSCAEEPICEALLDYLMHCGNFGRKQKRDAYAGERFISRIRSPRAAFRLLQRYGLMNWHACRRYRFLRPFAWLYQLMRYIRKGFSRRGTWRKMWNERELAQQRNALFDALDITPYTEDLATSGDDRRQE